MLLKATSLSKSYAGVQALRSADFELLAGEVHALVGENGAGKSTLIKILTGALQADGGRIELDGRAVETNDPVTARSLGIVAIYQQPALFPDLTVAENIALASEPSSLWRRIDWGERNRRARLVLGQIGGGIDPETYVRVLSMAHQQMVEIARALASTARVLILDEPTASLSHREVENLFRVIAQLRARGVGLVYISHRLEEVTRVADRVTVLRDGQTIETREMAEVDSSHLIRMMVGRELAAVFPKCEAPIADVMLESRLAGREFVVRAGEIVGVAGLVGAGRTELAETLFGLRPSAQGEILMRGNAAQIDSVERAIELGIAYVPEDRRRHGLVLDMPMRANTTLASLRQISRAGFLNFPLEREMALKYVGQLAIKTDSVDAPTSSLSGGNQQKVSLSRWLMKEPAVLILDEPTQGIDVGAKAEIHRLMGDMAKRGMAILMISSELPEILGMSDRVLVMRSGEIVGELARGEATPESLMRLAVGPGSSLSPPTVAIRMADKIQHVLLAYGVLLAVIGVVAPSFFSPANLLDVALGNVPVLIAAVGMTLVIVAEQIDISIGAQFAICGVACGLLAKSGWPMGVAAVLGAGLGALNGGLTAGLGIPAIVVTLATMAILRDSLRWGTQGAWVQNLPPSFQWFGLGQTSGEVLIFAIAAALFAAFAWGMRNLAAGRAIYAVGSDREAARLVGINTRGVVLGVFVLMGLLSGVAAMLSSIRFREIQSSAGAGLEMKAIAAVVVGGTAITGGRGRLVGTLLGVALMGTIGPALTYMGVNPYWEKAVQGAIILAAILRAR